MPGSTREQSIFEKTMCFHIQQLCAGAQVCFALSLEATGSYKAFS